MMLAPEKVHKASLNSKSPLVAYYTESGILKYRKNNEFFHNIAIIDGLSTEVL